MCIRSFFKFLESGVTVAILLLFRRPNGHKCMESNAYRDLGVFRKNKAKPYHVFFFVGWRRSVSQWTGILGKTSLNTLKPLKASIKTNNCR